MGFFRRDNESDTTTITRIALTAASSVLIAVGAFTTIANINGLERDIQDDANQTAKFVACVEAGGTYLYPDNGDSRKGECYGAGQ